MSTDQLLTSLNGVSYAKFKKGKEILNVEQELPKPQ